jgi:hypothetical protein
MPILEVVRSNYRCKFNLKVVVYNVRKLHFLSLFWAGIFKRLDKGIKGTSCKLAPAKEFVGGKLILIEFEKKIYELSDLDFTTRLKPLLGVVYNYVRVMPWLCHESEIE